MQRGFCHGLLQEVLVVELILRESIDHLGRRGDVVKVAAGYARNYLLPRGLALPVTETTPVSAWIRRS